MLRRREPARVSIQTERLALRMAVAGDEARISDFYRRNRDFLQPFSPTFDDQLFSVHSWRDRIAAIAAEYRAGKGLRLIILPKVDAARVIGIANFTMITGFPTFTCNLGYSMDENEQGKGVMTEALTAAISYAFDELGLHRIEANYMPRNEASGRVLEKLGFAREGYAKDYILIDGQWEDHVRTALTNPRWQP
jgi:ribosomal-protein-alanine N-acetyltransferase